MLPRENSKSREISGIFMELEKQSRRLSDDPISLTQSYEAQNRKQNNDEAHPPDYAVHGNPILQ